MYSYIYVVYFSLGFFFVFSHTNWYLTYIIVILKNQNNKLKIWVQSDFHHNNTYISVRWCIVKHKLSPYIFENRKLNSLQRGLKYNIRLHRWIRKTPSKTPFMNQTHWKWLSLMLPTMPTTLSIKKHVISNLKESFNWSLGSCKPLPLQTLVCLKKQFIFHKYVVNNKR